jgi:hypothetical protein
MLHDFRFLAHYVVVATRVPDASRWRQPTRRRIRPASRNVRILALSHDRRRTAIGSANHGGGNVLGHAASFQRRGEAGCYHARCRADSENRRSPRSRGSSMPSSVIGPAQTCCQRDDGAASVSAAGCVVASRAGDRVSAGRIPMCGIAGRVPARMIKPLLSSCGGHPGRCNH